MSIHPVSQLDAQGSGGDVGLAEARAACRSLARRRYENFTVLSHLVPRDRRDDFAALYAYCRWADDLGDEVGEPERALALLAWWREELDRCFAGEPRHHVFVALEPVIRRHDLPRRPFEDLVAAFEQDQRVTRYGTWEKVVGYCRLSANPVGRLVLMVLGEPRTPELFEPSDAICTALQLTNHWQDLRRDLEERDRIYVPRELIAIERFEERFRASAALGHAVDRTFLGESRALVRDLVERTWRLYEQGAVLVPRLRPASRPIVWLLAAGGRRVLRRIEEWSYETVLHRPKLGRAVKAMIVLEAAVRARLGRFGGGGVDGA